MRSTTRGGDQNLDAPSWPYHGEYASTTVFVTDDPPPSTSVIRHANPISAISVFSDGLERLALDLRPDNLSRLSLKVSLRPLPSVHHLGKDVELSENSTHSWEAMLSTAARTTKTLILAVRR